MAIDAIMRGRTAQGTAAWSVALLLLPILALPLYLVFGERKFAGYMRARRRGTSAIDHIAKELHERLRPCCTPPADDHAEYKALERLARFPFTTGNKAELLIDGQATFDAILAAIAGANRYILIQFYIFRDDGLGRRLQAALLDAAKRGVRVYFLYDEIGSYWLPRHYLDALIGAGCKCGGFRTKPRRQKPFRINFRNHRKIVVVDGQLAFVGGHNVGDEYLGLDPKLGPWRDTHVALRGPSVHCIQLTFVEDWYWANRSALDVDWTPVVHPESHGRVLVVPSGPADDLETYALLVTHTANCARKRLWVASAYFVPDEQTLGALQLAALRGVDVRIIIPDRSDGLLTWLSAFSYYNDIMPVGIKLYRYLPGFMHQKVILCDDAACVGTSNLDNRSLRINFEITVVLADKAFGEHARLMLETDMARSRLVERGEFERKPFWFRLACRVARLLSPIQ
jgi:cardiolipin synthase